ncbi:MAG: flagellar protein FlaG, partial [Firmicutes bacterium]|nr:flagellar protein FlaG [Bacillota bacterium]
LPDHVRPARVAQEAAQAETPRHKNAGAAPEEKTAAGAAGPQRDLRPHAVSPEDSVGMRQLLRIIEQAVKALRGRDVSLRFFVHEPTGQIMVRIIDRETQEVVREIPREEILDMIAKLWELAGLIVD